MSSSPQSAWDKEDKTPTRSVVPKIRNVFGTVKCNRSCALDVQANYSITVMCCPRRSIFERSVFCIVGDVSSISCSSLLKKNGNWCAAFSGNSMIKSWSIACFVMKSFTRKAVVMSLSLSNSLCCGDLRALPKDNLLRKGGLVNRC